MCISENITFIHESTKEGYAVVQTSVTIEHHNKLGCRVTYCGAADATPASVAKPFDKHLVAMAETRAEGRALRKALHLRKTVTAEEVMLKDPINIQSEDDFLTDNQIKIIDIMSRKDGRGMNVDVVKLLNDIFDEDTNFKSLSHADGISIINKLSEFQQSEVPKKLLGYNAEWQSEVK